MDEDMVVLLDFWMSLYGMRVKVALVEKGVKYEHKEEDLRKKSDLLLEMNPIHKKVPVLIHNGNPICESCIIVEYVDEVWNHKSPLLPSDPFKRSQARFWADYIDKKVYGVANKVLRSKGEELDEAKKELIEHLKTLEGVLGENPYFGGETFGFLDVAFIPYSTRFYCYENFGNFSMEVECPKLAAWANRCMEEKECVKETLPHPHKVYEHIVGLRQILGLQ